MIGLYLFQSQGLAEHSREAVAATLVAGGVDTLYVKAMDGALWEGHWDGGPMAVDGLEDLDAWRAVLHAAGVTMVPWVQPDDPGANVDLLKMAGLCAALANRYGEVVLDVEPGDDYWYEIDRNNYSHVAPFFLALRQQVAPGNRITVCYPAGWAMSSMRGFIRACDPFVDGYQSQDYWDVPTMASNDGTFRALSGKPKVNVLGTFGRMQAQLRDLASRQVPDAIIWDFAHMTQSLYGLLKSFPQDPPPPPPDPSGGWQEPGFAALYRAHPDIGHPRAEHPDGDAYSDADGNTWQRGDLGVCLWVKAFNRNYWLGRDGAVLGG